MPEAETRNPVLVARQRAGFVERVHHGRVAIVDGRSPEGALAAALGDVGSAFLPRSSCKILQALPMVESGAADAAKLSPRHLALSCASHQGSDAHATFAGEWLREMGFSETDLMCGAQESGDAATRERMIRAGEAPSQLHNNCSGKHSGFLCQAKHLRASAENYVSPDHPVQKAVAAATAELAGEEIAGHAIDGCSAPNFALSLTGLARAAARIAAAETALAGVRLDAAIRLRSAMAAHPFEVAGEGRCCTGLMRAGEGRFAVKTGAEGAFIAILPEMGLGVALKIDDGNTPAAECAMTGILVALGALDAGDERIACWLTPREVNRRGLVCGGGALSQAITGLRLS
ncbi:asparaginase [Pikeienuella piscinae]|uniref:Asparaginase n=1 Tax=Pikeienuella piscinae TaxID=2748098 RepID=A0A7L5BZD4_9RHOB|nr:asparaginase [Pikeienuella piscinae]QIE56463.1 asparaginase [Pikeienuella piscinae]